MAPAIHIGSSLSLSCPWCCISCLGILLQLARLPLVCPCLVPTSSQPPSEAKGPRCFVTLWPWCLDKREVLIPKTANSWARPYLWGSPVGKVLTKRIIWANQIDRLYGGEYHFQTSSFSRRTVDGVVSLWKGLGRPYD